MPELCSHEFKWPERAADGGYYQSCALCGAEYTYDWINMRRMEHSGGEIEPASAPPPLRSSRAVDPKTAPCLTLLLEPEPAYRVFFRNLADLLSRRSGPRVDKTSTSATFWRDVFVESKVSWWWFLESMLGHVIAIAVVVIVCQVWTPPDPSLQKKIFDQSYISYYRPPQTFPALRSGPARPRVSSKKGGGSGHQASIRVPGEHREGVLSPPDIKLTAPTRPIIASNPALPAMPLSAVGRPQLPVPAGLTSVVAPAPVVGQGTSRAPQLGLPQAAVIAPPADVAAISSRPAIAALRGAAIVAPPPTVQGSMRGSLSGMADMNIGHSEVVAPAPVLPVEEQRSAAGMTQGLFGQTGSSVVPPPPSIQRPFGNGRGSSLSGTGVQVVPPPPSVQSAGSSGGGQAASWLSSSGVQAVPPPVSVQGEGHSDGSGRGNLLAGTNLQVVPPPPSIQGTGDSGGSERAGSLSSGGVEGLAPSGSQGQGSGNSTPGESGGGDSSTMAKADQEGSQSSAEGDDASGTVTQELPLRLIGLALALPNSSYFSNYEVFIAERAISKVKSQLIKLVYVSLPYQRRLSEYALGTSRVYKLRVRRDSTCDESLIEMTWPETDPRPDSRPSTDSPALSRKDRNDMLPCYRTTADDNRKELSRVH
jgi:hypothetical protein